MKKLKNLSVSFLIAALVSSIAYGKGLAGEISVTKVVVKGNRASIVINGVIEIKEIELKGEDIIFPYYTSKSGKISPQVRFLTDESKKIVREAIVNNTPSKQKIRNISYKVTKMSPYSRAESSLKAFVVVTFNGVMEVECKLMKSSSGGEDWVAWPARPPVKEKGEKRWIDQIVIRNRNVKSIIENEIIKTYEKAGKSGNVMTDVEVDLKQGVVNDSLTVTDVVVQKRAGEGGLVSVAQVELNYAFRIKNIKVYEKRGYIFLEFPRYVSKSGREYDQIKIFSRKLRDEIKKAIKSGQPSNNKSKEIGFEITKFDEFKKEGSNLKYFCAVTLNGAVEIECKIFDSGKFPPFISWPSTKEGDEYVNIVFPVNRKVKSVIEKTLLDRYYKEKTGNKLEK